MKKLSTLKKLTLALDVFLGIEDIANIPQESKDQVIEFLQVNAKSIMQKQKEKETIKKIAEDRKSMRTKNQEQGKEIETLIADYFKANPNLIASASDLCANIPEFKAQGFKSQKLTRRLINLQEQKIIKVVETKPKKLFQLN